MPTVDPAMRLITSIQFVICSFGVVINGFFIFVMMKNRYLRTPCGLMIMWMVIFDFITEFSLVSVPSMLVFFNTTIPLITCFWAMEFCSFANAMTQWMMLLISLDRLNAVAFPINYKNSKNSRHKYVVIAICISSAITLSWQGYLYYPTANAIPDKPVFCQPTDFMSGIALAVGWYIVITQNITTISVYLLIWSLLSCKIVKKMENKSDHRVLVSLVVLMTIVFCCWLCSSLFNQLVLPLFQLPADTQNVLIRLALQLQKIGMVANAPVLYIFSTEYRNSIGNELKKLWIWSKFHSQGVQATTIQVQPL